MSKSLLCFFGHQHTSWLFPSILCWWPTWECSNLSSWCLGSLDGTLLFLRRSGCPIGRRSSVKVAVGSNPTSDFVLDYFWKQVIKTYFAINIHMRIHTGQHLCKTCWKYFNSLPTWKYTWEFTQVIDHFHLMIWKGQTSPTLFNRLSSLRSFVWSSVLGPGHLSASSTSVPLIHYGEFSHSCSIPMFYYVTDLFWNPLHDQVPFLGSLYIRHNIMCRVTASAVVEIDPNAESRQNVFILGPARLHSEL